MPTRKVDLLTSLGRYLAEDVISDIDMPPFRKAAVDGYACRRSELFQPLSLSGILPAGGGIPQNLPQHCCYKIMTGARVPEDSDCIFMVEQSELTSDGKIIFTGKETSANICVQGEDCKAGDIVVKRNTFIKPQHIAIFASVGYTQVEVYSKPRVAIIVTGDELTEPDIRPEGSQIRNSNGWQLITQVMSSGGEPDYRGILSDKKETLFEAISKAVTTSEIVLLTGGVSKGDFDFVPEILQTSGAEIHFKEVAVQPGRPTLFAKLRNVAIFGLPGNPVSTLIQFNLLVKPFIQKMMSGSTEENYIYLPMGILHSRKKAGRQSFFPVEISNGEVFPVRYNGSAHIRSFAGADGIVSFEKSELTIAKGQVVKMIPL